MDVNLDARHDFLRRYATPTGWVSCELGTLATVVGGATPSRDESHYWSNGNIPWATPTDITACSSKYISSTAECITDAGLASSAAKLLPVGAVLFTSRATIGAKAISTVPMATNQGFATFVPTAINGDYLYYLLDALLPSIKRLGAGTTFDEVSKRDLRKVWCSIPASEHEQAAIAQVLDAVDNAIQSTRIATERACELDHSLLHDLLEKGIAGRHGNRKPNWPIHRLDEVADVGSGVTLGKDVSGFKTVELPYLRVANVQDGHLDLSTIKTVRVRVEEVESYRLEAGDVLVTEGGDLDKLGRGTIWHGEIPNCLHQNHIFRIRAKQDQLRPYFLALVVESDIAKRYFLRVAKRTTNLASINKTVLRAFRFPVPDPAEQEEIENVMKAVKATVKTLSDKERALQALKKSLMYDLLTGAVRVKASLSQIAEAV